MATRHVFASWSFPAWQNRKPFKVVKPNENIRRGSRSAQWEPIARTYVDDDKSHIVIIFNVWVWFLCLFWHFSCSSNSLALSLCSQQAKEIMLQVWRFAIKHVSKLLKTPVLTEKPYVQNPRKKDALLNPEKFSPNTSSELLILGAVHSNFTCSEISSFRFQNGVTKTKSLP